MRSANEYRPDPIELPPTGIDHPKIRPVAEKYAKLLAAERAAVERYAELQDERVKALQADRQALADAKRKSQPDPGYEAVRQADDAIEQARREAEALAVAVDDQRSALADALAKYGAEHEAKVAERVRAARGAYDAALDKLAAAHDQLADELSMARWLREAPAVSRWRATLGIVTHLTGPNGDPHAWGSVLALLRSHGQPQQPAFSRPVEAQRRVTDVEMSAWHLSNGGRLDAETRDIRAAYAEHGPRRADAALDTADREAA